MKLKNFRLAEAIIGLFLTLFVVYSYFLFNTVFNDPSSIHGFTVFSWLEGVELRLYDMRSKLRTSIDAGDKEIVIVAIDDDSLARHGRWPWPRTVIADMVNKLAEAKPKVLGIDILYSEPESAQGADQIKDLKGKFEDLVKTHKLRPMRGVDFAPEFDTALDNLNFDGKLKDAFAKAGNVVLPMNFSGGGLRGAKPEPMPAAIAAQALKVHMVGVDSGSGRSTDGMKPFVPIPEFQSVVQGVGYVNVIADFDGTVRREYPVMKYDEAYYPSFALELVARYLGYDSKDLTLTPGKSLEIGKNVIPLDGNQSMLISFNGPNNTFHTYSFDDVLNGKVAMDVFKDKIVLLGPSAPGISTLYVAPVTHNLPATELMANVIENILHLRFLTRPVWAPKMEYGAIVLVGLFLMFVLPYLGAMGGAIVTLLLLALVGGVGTSYFIKGLWLKIGYPSFLLIGGYVLITTKRLFMTEKGKELVEASAIETNKMLGLSFQGQGQLDLAFEKFRTCPLDETMRDLLYNLGLDFERKRQYSKAAAVYEHIATKHPNYKDTTDKIKMLKQAAQGAVFGGIGAKKQEGTVLITSSTSKPTLGRYEVETELGRGAMGIVYLGNDPKINRKVAIKTMVLEEGTDAAAVKETKERFFREAESAGTLNHPNIVRIFDAGEENDVAYIAMEFLEGHDLVRYTQKAALLPPETVLEYVSKVADALDYANAQGIVHRDIKPANVMLLKDGTIRVTDFGIARITASSKTATGTVVGTPAYMSPEQVGGKKVDGRSDLFSLGVMLYELLLGEKPFKGGEGGLGTLLFQIANDPEPEPLEINPKLPPQVVEVIHKALKKDSNERYQRGGEMAIALRLCLKIMKEGATEAAVMGPKPAEKPAPAVAAPEPAPAPAIPPMERTMPAAGAVAATPPPSPSAPPAEITIPEAAPAASAEAAPPSGLERPRGASAIFGSSNVPPPPKRETSTVDVPPPPKHEFGAPTEKTLSPEEIAANITMPSAAAAAAAETTMPEAATASAPPADFDRTIPAGGIPPIQPRERDVSETTVPGTPAAGAGFGKSTIDLTLPEGGASPASSAEPALPQAAPSGFGDRSLSDFGQPIPAPTAAPELTEPPLPQTAAAPVDYDRTIPAGGIPPLESPAPAPAAAAPVDYDRTIPAGGIPPLQSPAPAAPAPANDFDRTMPAGGFPPAANANPEGGQGRSADAWTAPPVASPAPQPAIELTAPEQAAGKSLEEAFGADQTMKVEKPK